MVLELKGVFTWSLSEACLVWTPQVIYLTDLFKILSHILDWHSFYLPDVLYNEESNGHMTNKIRYCTQFSSTEVHHGMLTGDSSCLAESLDVECSSYVYQSLCLPRSRCCLLTPHFSWLRHVTASAVMLTSQMHACWRSSWEALGPEFLTCQ